MVVCAAIVFVLLFRRDFMQSTAKVPIQPVKVGTPRPIAIPDSKASTTQNTGAPATTAGNASDAAKADNPVGSAASATGRTEFRLKRSNGFQKVGAYGVMLGTCNRRRGTCSVSVRVGPGNKAQHRTVQIRRPVQIAGDDGASITLRLEEITKDGIVGSLESSR